MMTYKEWNLLTSEQLNGIAIDYIDPEGKSYSEPFCFYTLDEALNYGKMRIDQLVSLQKKGTQDVQSRAIA